MTLDELSRTTPPEALFRPSSRVSCMWYLGSRSCIGNCFHSLGPTAAEPVPVSWQSGIPVNLLFYFVACTILSSAHPRATIGAAGTMPLFCVLRACLWPFVNCMWCCSDHSRVGIAGVALWGSGCRVGFAALVTVVLVVDGLQPNFHAVVLCW